MTNMVLKETAGVEKVEKGKKSRIFTRDRTSSSNKYKKSPMPKTTSDNDHGRVNDSSAMGSTMPGENVGSIAEVRP